MPKHTPESLKYQYLLEVTDPKPITLGHNAYNLSNQQFGRLTAVSPVARTKNSQVLWLCLCKCGNKTLVQAGNLTSKHTQSCGCYSVDVGNARRTTHRLAKHPLYHIWGSIIGRCTNPTNSRYKYYGGRPNPITICDEWRHDFQAFYDYVTKLPDYGKEKFSIDRLDNSKGYEPGNIRYATAKQQARNTRNNRLLTYNGITMCTAEWSEAIGVKAPVVADRLRDGWSIERALQKKPKRPKQGKILTFNNKSQRVSDWSKELGISTMTLYWRIRQGFPIEKILSPEVRTRPKKKSLQPST